MNLKEAVSIFKSHMNYSNERVADFFGVSRSKIDSILAGHTNVEANTLLRISAALRISIDELLDNAFLPPFYHFSHQAYAMYIKAEKTYPEFCIQEGDILYVRPFIHDSSKKGQLIVTLHNDLPLVERYTGNPSQYLSMGKVLFLHVVGLSRLLGGADEGINIKQSLETTKLGTARKKVGRPLKLDH